MTDLAKIWARNDAENRAIGGAQPTGSMLPTLDSKSVLLLERIGQNTVLRVGDVIGTKQGIMHRLVRVDGGYLILRGDNNQADDRPIQRKDAEWRLAGILYTNGQ